jgi:hypothetical protein
MLYSYRTRTNQKIMSTKLTTGVIAAAALMLALSSVAVAVTITTVNAIGDNWDTDCKGPGNSGNEGECKGGSEKSGPHDEVNTNPGGHQPPGQQEDDD